MWNRGTESGYRPQGDECRDSEVVESRELESVCLTSSGPTNRGCRCVRPEVVPTPCGRRMVVDDRVRYRQSPSGPGLPINRRGGGPWEDRATYGSFG